jgi:hypothetical protein
MQVVDPVILEGSEDGNSWTELHRQPRDESARTIERRTVSFAVSKPSKFRFLRMRQEKGLTRDFVLEWVEFYGDLFELPTGASPDVEPELIGSSFSPPPQFRATTKF